MILIPYQAKNNFVIIRPLNFGGILGKLLFFSFGLLLCFSPSSLYAGTIYGSIRIKGVPPLPEKIIVDKDDYCKKSGKERVSDSLLVSKKGGVRNAVLSVSGVSGSFTPPEEVVLIDQKNCAYAPHVTVIQAGTPVDISSSDPVNHNVRSNPEENEPVNYAMPEPMVIPLPDLMNPESIRLTCDIHKWMSAYIVVTENPFFAITDGNGSFEISNLPEGAYKIRAWHETLGIQTKRVVVPASGKVAVNFLFSVKEEAE